MRVLRSHKFLSSFCKELCSIAFPFTELLKKEWFHWNDTTQKAFDDLKSAMSTSPVLSLPDFNEPFLLFTNASGLGMRVVVQQKKVPNCIF